MSYIQLCSFIVGVSVNICALEKNVKIRFLVERLALMSNDITVVTCYRGRHFQRTSSGILCSYALVSSLSLVSSLPRHVRHCHEVQMAVSCLLFNFPLAKARINA